MSPNNIGLNELISWKGRTFNQITSHIIKNGAIDPSINLGNNIFKKRGGRPLKIYRREIVVPIETSCNERTSVRIDLLNTPGGSINSSVLKNGSGIGLVNMMDFDTTTSMRVPIYIGSSASQSKVITIPYTNISISHIPTNYQNPSWSDRFSVNLIGNQLTVTRIDAAAGWAQLLSLEGWIEDACVQSANCVAESVGNTQSNALRRLRSGGMVKKQFDISTNKQTYYTNSQQYINSRNRGFTQNQYYYTRTGNQSAKPGDSLSTNNIYTTNTITDCKKFFVSMASSFSYTWVNEPTGQVNSNNVPVYYDTVGNRLTYDPASDPILYYTEITPGNLVLYTGVRVRGNSTPPAIVTVNVPAGYYNINDINDILHNTMTANRHYYRRLNNQSKVYLMSFALNGTTGLVEFTVSPTSTAIVTANVYSKAVRTTTMGVDETTEWITPSVSTTPRITIADNLFKSVIGFGAGNYPVATLRTNTSDTSEETFVGTSLPLLLAEGNRVYYKPNNPQFAQQGAVTSSSRITRIKYDTITNSAASYTTAFGLQVSNALAYGVPANGYTIKDKLGYPNKNTPVVTATGEMRFCR